MAKMPNEWRETMLSLVENLVDMLCGFRFLVVLCGFYPSDKPRNSDECDRYHVMAVPPLVHGKRRAASGNQ
jgi:hypothetical protein